MIKKEILDNGLVILIEKRPIDLAAIAACAKVGTWHEEAKINGISHYLEHLLFCGTKKYPQPTQVGVEMESIGGYLNASTNKERIIANGVVLPKFFDNGLDIISEMVQNPLLLEEQVEKERKVIFEEIKRSDDNLNNFTWKSLMRLLFENNSYGLPTPGTKESVSNIKREDFVAYFESNYVPNNLIISIVGGISEEPALKKIKEYFGNLPRKKVKTPEFPADNQKFPRENIFEKEGQQAQVFLGFRVPGLEKSKESTALRLLNVYLGNGKSVLFNEIRTKRRLAYDAHSEYDNSPGKGSILLYAGVKTESIDEVRGIFEKELEKIRNGEIDQKNLSRAKEFITGKYAMSRETVFEEARKLTWFEQMGVLDSINDWTEMLRPLKAKDIVEVAQKYIDPNKYCWAILKPKA